MSGQTLHRDYYPLSLIQVGLHYALVELPVVLLAVVICRLVNFLNNVERKKNSKKRSRLESSFNLVVKVPIQLCKNVFL